MKKVFKTIYYILLTFIILIAVLLVVSVFPIPGNIKLMVVQSGSMEPAIKMGSVVMVKPIKEYRVGDVITFGSNSKDEFPITHRITDIKERGSVLTYITKGDANEEADIKSVSQREVLGKVLFSVPYAGYAVAGARKPVTFMLIILIPAVIIISDEMRKIIKEIKKKKASSYE